MSPNLVITVVVVVTAVIFDFLNGFHDSANVVATTISSRALSPRKALILAALAEAAGPFLFGVAVATTIGHEIVSAQAISSTVILAGLLGAIAWNIITWLLGIPSSSSHALIGGLVGAVAMGDGFSAIQIAGIRKVIIALLVSPILGLVVGYAFMKLLLWLSQLATPSANRFFKGAQVLTSLALALSHGTNDAQKTMGIITMALLSGGFIDTFHVPIWVVAVCAGAIALGTLTGAWRIIRTLGAKFYRIRPIHGFSAQAASAAVILGAALLGGPVSTTQVVSSTIIGVGSAERVSKVRWGVAGEILLAWILTIPASMLMSALLYIPLHAWLG
jgi:PiT family inorganic phosphate transporter